MNRHLIGIDGGGTSTKGALFDLDGTMLRTAEDGFANFRVDAPTAKAHVLHVIETLAEGVGFDAVDGIVIGLAGIPAEADRLALETELATRYHTPVFIVTDALLALHSIRQDSEHCVVLVLGGTGSAVLIGNGEDHDRIGGYGHLLGDEGSAYHLAIRALKQVIRQLEEGRTPSPLAQAILQEIHARDQLDIKDFVYANHKQKIAELARFLASYAEAGDEEARTLFRHEGELLAEQTLLALKRVDVCDTVRIGFRGSFLLHAPLVKDVLIERLEAQHIPYVIDKHPVDPVVGAYHLGLRKLLRGDKI